MPIDGLHEGDDCQAGAAECTRAGGLLRLCSGPCVNTTTLARLLKMGADECAQ
jgi:hypothetical protein